MKKISTPVFTLLIFLAIIALSALSSSGYLSKIWFGSILFIFIIGLIVWGIIAWSFSIVDTNIKIKKKQISNNLKVNKNIKVLDGIKRLKKMYNQGYLSKVDFEMAKNKLLK